MKLKIAFKEIANTYISELSGSYKCYTINVNVIRRIILENIQ